MNRLAIACLSLPILFGGYTAANEPLTASDMKALVQRHLATDPAYRPGDLISQDEVEPIFNDLLALKIQPSDDAEEMYDSFLPGNNYLVRTLRTPEGRRFMQQVSHFTGAYDRLERLAWMPEGRALLVELIASSDGAAEFGKMCTPEGMEYVAKQLSRDPRGQNFSLPTGHVHTADELLHRLEGVVAHNQSK